MSKLRLLSSYSSMTAILAFAGWFAFASFPLIGDARVEAEPYVAAPAPAATPAPEPVAPAVVRRSVPAPVVQEQLPPLKQAQRAPSVPLPYDGREPVTGAVQVAVTPMERAAALSLLTAARENSNMHIPTMWPYILNVTFVASGTVPQTGSGELTETWLSGQKWIWTANVGNFSIARVGVNGMIADQKPVSAIPSRVQMLRETIFWANRNPIVGALRTAAARVNGKQVTCVLNSGMQGPGSQARLWEEEERCIDPSSGAIQLYSLAPGTYAIFGYSKNLRFHSRILPDQITIYIGGTVAVDAQINLTDAGNADSNGFTITQEMMANGPAIEMTASRFAVNTSSPLVTGEVRPVIVRATLDPQGNVLEEELSSSADPSLTQAALDLVKQRNFGPHPLQRDAYVNVRFASQQAAQQQ